MSVWLVRGGRWGEHEERFLSEGRVYLTFRAATFDLGPLSKEQVRERIEAALPQATVAKVGNLLGQFWRFSHEMKPGDWVLIPGKQRPVVHVGQIRGDYHYVPSDDSVYRHWREVTWHAEVPRANFPPALKASLSALQTICQISKNNAEQIIESMAKNNWSTPSDAELQKANMAAEEWAAGDDIDLEEVARNRIAEFIIQKFKGHEMARLVEAVLVAQGCETYRSPPGPDHGVDILAAPGPLGFGDPRICVQVKSGDKPVDEPTLNQLTGAMHNVGATQGLLVSWGGFKQTVLKSESLKFFHVRLWSQNDLIDELLKNFDRLPEDIRSELPLKRVWILSQPEDS